MFGFIPKIKNFIESVRALVVILSLLIEKLDKKDKEIAKQQLEVIKKHLKDFEN